MLAVCTEKIFYFTLERISCELHLIWSRARFQPTELKLWIYRLFYRLFLYVSILKDIIEIIRLVVFNDWMSYEWYWMVDSFVYFCSSNFVFSLLLLFAGSFSLFQSILLTSCCDSGNLILILFTKYWISTICKHYLHFILCCFSFILFIH